MSGINYSNFLFPNPLQRLSRHSKTILLLVLLILVTKPSQGMMKTKLGSVNARFAGELYRNIALKTYDRYRNFAISPIAISTTLALIYGGAEGRSKEQIRRAMNLEGFTDDLQLHEAYRSLLLDISRPDNNYTYHLASRLYVSKEVSIRREFAINVERYYASTVETIDFQSNLETSRQAINSWVLDKTRQRVKEIAPYYGLTRDTSLLPVSASYFRASWKHPFNQAKTRQLPFQVSSRDRQWIDMMELDGKALGYYNAQELAAQVLEIPYQGNKLSMIIMLPHEIDGMIYVEDGLPTHLVEVLNRVRKQWVNVKIPKFSLDFEIPLKQYLQLTGIDDIFDYNMADLSLLGTTSSSGYGKLYAKEFLHKVYVSVDEYGSGEALATGALNPWGTLHGDGADDIAPHPPPVQFMVDRPFLYMVVEKGTGSILIMGRYVQPAYKPEYLGYYGENGAAGGAEFRVFWCLFWSLICAIFKFLRMIF